MTGNARVRQHGKLNTHGWSRRLAKIYKTPGLLFWPSCRTNSCDKMTETCFLTLWYIQLLPDHRQQSSRHCRWAEGRQLVRFLDSEVYNYSVNK